MDFVMTASQDAFLSQLKAKTISPESSDEQGDTLKIVFLGDTGVGQTGFLSSLMAGSLKFGQTKPLEITTRVIDNYCIDEHTVCLEIIELASSGRDYDERRDTLIMEAAAIVLVYSVANPVTFDVLTSKYKPLVERLKSRTAAVGVVGLIDGLANEQEVENAKERLEVFRMTWEYDDVIQGLSRDELFQSRSHTGQFIAELVRLVIEHRELGDSSLNLVIHQRKCVWF